MSIAMVTKERPILFSGAMVRAILEGRKTQTRRVIKPQPAQCSKCLEYQLCWEPNGTTHHCFDPVSAKSTASAIPARYSPYGQTGDRLWVRETWCYYGAGDAHIGYKATDEICPDAIDRWRPSIHMPRAVSRIALEVTEVRAQRLQDISEEDAIAEGIPKDEWFGLLTVQKDFQKLWDSINTDKHPWDINPWVWAVSFRQLGGE